MAIAETLTERAVRGDVRLVRFSFAETVEAGSLAGLAGAVLMAGASMLAAAAAGYGALFPLNLVGATFRGPEALVAGPAVMASGLAIHLLMAMVLGVGFSMMVTRQTPFGVSLLGGVVLALVVLAVTTSVVLPYSNPVMRQRVILAPGAWFLSHVLFGAGLGLVPLLKRYLARP